MRPAFMLAPLVCLSALAAACGSSANSGSGSPSGGEPTTPSSAGQVHVTGPLGQKPNVTIPNASPPTTLVTEDLHPGDGPAATAGKTVTVQYVGLAWSNKQQFDASWDNHQPFSFPLGQGQVIQGWDQGVDGMREGGRRLLVIPPALGYGPSGTGPIGPNETLVFVVDLLEVK